MAKAKSSNTRVRKLNIKQKKQVVKTSKTLPGSFRLFGAAIKHIWTNKKLLGLVLLVYIALYVILVKGFATGFQLDDARATIEDSSDGGSLSTATALFGELIGTAGSTSGEAASVYQTGLFVVMSLAIIWALRQTFDGRKKIAIKEVFYKSMQPLVPYVLIGLIIVLQVLPALLGVTLYGIVVGNNIASSPIELILWVLFLGISFGASIYLLTSSIIASYIVTLPGMTPLQALRSSRKLIRFRRWQVVRKLLFLPVIITVILLVLFLPLVFFATALAEVIFLLFMLVLLLVVHAYLFVMYRELL